MNESSIINMKKAQLDLQAIIILVIFAIFTIPFLFKFLAWSNSAVVSPTPEKIAEGAQLIAENEMPWWLGIFQWLVGLPGIIAAVLIIAFVFLLKWLGEIK